MKQASLFPHSPEAILSELDLKEAENIANQVKSAATAHCDKIEVAGSVRRQREKVHDIDFVVVTRTDVEWQEIGQELKALKAISSCSGNSVIKALLPCRRGLFQVDFYRAQQSNFGILLLVRTGSAEHNAWLASLAISKGMRLKYSQGLLKDDNVIAGTDEKGVFAALDLPCPTPSEREIVDSNPVWLQREQQQYDKIWEEIKRKT